MKKIFVLFSFFLLFCLDLFGGGILSYKVKNYCIDYHGEEYRVIREFKKDGKNSLVVVDTSSLKSYILDSSFEKKKIGCRESKFSRLLKLSALAPYPLKNDGIRSFRYGIYLTVDMCPSSKKGYERDFFKKLIEKFANPVPLTLFVTKRWIVKHPKEFSELKRWDSEGKLAITWGNHTAYHFYKRGLALEQNFVLYRHEHFEDDVLELEKFLIQSGVVPSVFFRFPGLISNKKVVKKLKQLSLVAIGSDAWIAKKQFPKSGSIVLVHGNKNEPLGIKRFVNYMKKLEVDSFYPLSSAY